VVGNPASCSTTSAGGRCKVTIPALSTSGTYSASLLPSGGTTATGSITVSQDLTGALAAGTPESVGPTREAQNVAYTFSGTAGEYTAIKYWGLSTTPAGQSLTATVYRPDGIALSASSATTASSGILNFASLPLTGTYQVRLEQFYGAPWQATLSQDSGAALVVNGATATLSTTQSEPLRFQFTGSAGQRTEWAIGGLAYSGGATGSTSFVIWGPTGGSVDNFSCTSTTAGCESWSNSLPTSGTYSVAILPPSGVNISGGTLAISTPLAGTFTVGGGGQAINIARPGQTARYTFAGTASQLLRLNWTAPSGSTGSTANVSVLNPSGTSIKSQALVNGTADGFDIPALPATGTYTVVVDPTFAGSAAATFTLVTR
jgi:hypothetical protein